MYLKQPHRHCRMPSMRNCSAIDNLWSGGPLSGRRPQGKAQQNNRRRKAEDGTDLKAGRSEEELHVVKTWGNSDARQGQIHLKHIRALAIHECFPSRIVGLAQNQYASSGSGSPEFDIVDMASYDLNPSCEG